MRAQNRLRAPAHAAASSRKNLEFELQRAVGGGGDARLEIDERVGGEAHRARHRLAVDEGRVVRRLEQPFPRRLRRLEEIAEHVVVLDLELTDAGLFGVARLHVGDHAPALVAQAPSPRRVRPRSPAWIKPPSRRLSGSSSASAGASRCAERAVVAPQPRIGVEQRRRARRSRVSSRPATRGAGQQAVAQARRDRAGRRDRARAAPARAGNPASRRVSLAGPRAARAPRRRRRPRPGGGRSPRRRSAGSRAARRSAARRPAFG